MRARLLQVSERLRTGYWLLPGLMGVAAAILAEVLVAAERAAPGLGEALSRLSAAGHDASVAVLTAITGSMITVGATVFSIIMLTLSTASQQFGPRLLRIFMRDRWNQFSLGVFTCTFVYCLLVLRTVQDPFVPRLAVAAAMLLALASVAVLVMLIHHVSVLIQAPQVIAVVTRELDAQIDDFFPQEIGDEARVEPPAPAPRGWEAAAHRVILNATGYVEVIDGDAILGLASARDVLIRLLVRPGVFAVSGQCAALVWPPGRADPEVDRRLAASILLSRRRTPAQDPEFAVRQLVEVGARALSAAINDPFTAAACADHLAAALSKLAVRRMPSPHRADAAGRLRLIMSTFTFEELLHLAYEPLRHYGASHPLVLARLIDGLAHIGGVARRPGDRAALADELDRIRAAVAAMPPGDPQRAHLEGRIAEARAIIVRDAGPASRATQAPELG